jgi:hypothetical protein
MTRGEIWWATLSAPNGSSPGYRRPILIIQANEFTQSRFVVSRVLFLKNIFAFCLLFFLTFVFYLPKVLGGQKCLECKNEFLHSYTLLFSLFI